MKALKRLLAAAMAVNMLSNYSSVLLVTAEDGEESSEPEIVEEAPVVEEAPQEVYEEPAPAPAPEPVQEPEYTEPAEEPVYEEPVQEPLVQFFCPQDL